MERDPDILVKLTAVSGAAEGERIVSALGSRGIRATTTGTLLIPMQGSAAAAPRCHVEVRRADVERARVALGEMGFDSRRLPGTREWSPAMRTALVAFALVALVLTALMIWQR